MPKVDAANRLTLVTSRNVVKSLFVRVLYQTIVMSGEGAQLPCALMVGAVTLCSWALSSSYRAQLPTDLFYFFFFFFLFFFFFFFFLREHSYFFLLLN